MIRVRDYRSSLPTPENVLRPIEVPDTTLSYDRGMKLPLYAQALISEVWIVDLGGEKVERHTGSSGDGYRHIELARRGSRSRRRLCPRPSFRWWPCQANPLAFSRTNALAFTGWLWATVSDREASSLLASGLRRCALQSQYRPYAVLYQQHDAVFDLAHALRQERLVDGYDLGHVHHRVPG